MSKYPTRIFINNPEKKVPDDLMAGFLTVLKSGDLDQIRKYVVNKQIKLNLVERQKDKIEETPAHIILSLDDVVADDDRKRDILKYLAVSGAALDVPDNQNVWPIHLAAKLQNKDIIKILVDNKVDIARQDSSNNTALHVAVVGKELECRKPSKIGSLIATPSIDKLPLSTELEKSNKEIVKLLNSNTFTEPRDELIQIINTISRINELYKNTDDENSIKQNIIKIFTDVSSDPSYSGGFSKQQQRLNQLVEETTSSVQEKIFKGVSTPLDISPGNTGWGPNFPNPPNPPRAPTDLEKILRLNRKDRINSLKKELTTDINKINIDEVKKFEDSSEKQYITKMDELIRESKNTIYGDENLKKFFLLMYTDYVKHSYPKIFAELFVNLGKNIPSGINTNQYYVFYSKTFSDVIYELEYLKNTSNKAAPPNIPNPPVTANTNYISYLGWQPTNITFAMKQYIADLNSTNGPVTDQLLNAYQAYTFVFANASQSEPIYRETLQRLLFKSNIAENVIQRYGLEITAQDSISKILSHPEFSEFRNDFNKITKQANKNMGFSWFELLDLLIKDIAPVATKIPIPGSFPAKFRDENLFYLFEIKTGNVPNSLSKLQGMNSFNVTGPNNSPLDYTDFIKSSTYTYPQYNPLTGTYYPIKLNAGKKYVDYDFDMAFRVINVLRQVINNRESTKGNTYSWGMEIPRYTTPNMTFLEWLTDLETREYTNSLIFSKYPELIFLDKIITKLFILHLKFRIEEAFDSAIRKMQVINPTNSAITTASNNFLNLYTRLQPQIKMSDVLAYLIPGFLQITDSSVDINTYVNSIINVGTTSQNIQNETNKLINETRLEFNSKRYELIDQTSLPFIYHLIDNIITNNRLMFNTNADVVTDKDFFNRTVKKFNKKFIELYPLGNTSKLFTNINYNIHEQKLITHFSNNIINLETVSVNFINYINNWEPNTFILEYEGQFLISLRKILNNIINLPQNTRVPNRQVNTIRNMSSIIEDIIYLFGQNIYYFIAQLSLPTFVGIYVNIVYRLKDILNIIRNHVFVYENSITFKPIKDDPLFIISKLNQLNGSFDKNFLSQFPEKIYFGSLPLIKYYNDIVSLLNKANFLKILEADNTSFPANLTNYFTSPLPLLDTFPKNLDDTDFDILIAEIMRNYVIDAITYYGPNGLASIQTIISDDPAIGTTTRQVLIYYRGFPNIKSVNTSTPTNEGQINWKLNGTTLGNKGGIPGQILTYTPAASGTNILTGNGAPLNTLGANGDIYIDNLNGEYHIKNAGAWAPQGNVGLGAVGITPILTYDASFIGFTNGNFVLNRTDQLPYLDRNFLKEYIVLKKQKIIELIVQKIVDEKDTTYKTLYDSIKNLGSSVTYEKQDLSDVKTYAVIAKLIDTNINKIIDYTVKTSSYNLVMSEITNTGLKTPLVDANVIKFVKTPDYLKVALQDVDRKAVQDLLTVNNKNVKYILPQVEQNPNDIPLSTHNYKFIHYLYNINYFSDANLSNTKACFKINPEIIDSLANSTTVNLQNSDGNTPLHIAAQVTHPDIIRKLLSYNAKPFAFKNNRGETPFDISRENLLNHIDYTDGNTLTKMLSNFIISFNDLLLTRLKDEKFKNNVIKYVHMAVPIQLIMYNHMFNVFLHNYRYNISKNVKNDLVTVIKKYSFTTLIYPYDLLTVDSPEELNKILEDTENENVISRKINETNANKIKIKNQQLEEINNQITGITDEKNNTTDQEMINTLSKLLGMLTVRKQNLENNINSLTVTNTKISPGVLSMYYSGIDVIKNNFDDRSADILEFYNYSFRVLSKTTEFQIALWRNYLSKNITKTPTMIFHVLNTIILQIINKIDLKNKKTTEECRLDLLKIFEFFEMFKRYVDMKESLPQIIDQDENPILKDEYDQIIYLINLILTPATTGIIINFIFKSLQEMDGAETLFTSLDTEMSDILALTYNGQTIEQYVENTMPLTMIKYFTKTYQNSLDTTQNIISADEIFLPIINIIKSYKKITINDESLIIKNLKESILPFLINTYQNFIHSMRLTIYGYERYHLQTYQSLSVVLEFLKNI